LGYESRSNQNRLRAEDIEKVVSVFERYVSVKRYSRVISLAEIREQDCNLNIRRYADTSPPPEIFDVKAILHGGVPVREVEDEYVQEEILQGFEFGPHDAFILISTSGIRPLIVEMAMGAKARGLPVIAMLSKPHGDQSPPAHSSGQKLMDLADVVLDNQCPPGDCVLELAGLEWRTGPVSPVTGAMLMNMLRCAVAERLLARGIKPELLPSHQFVGNVSAEEQLARFYEGYRKSLKHLYE